MNKQQFLAALAEALKKMPREERYKTLAYYDELVDDRVEDGMSEYEAIEKLGSVEVIARDLLGAEENEAEPKEKMGGGRRALVVTLLVLGFPLWGSLMLVALTLLLVAYILLYLPVLILGTLSLGFFAGSLFGLAGTPFLIADAGLMVGVFQLGACIAVLGLSVLCAVAFYYATKGILKASKAIWRRCTKLVRKRAAV